jgi:hypothetical protein
MRRKTSTLRPRVILTALLVGIVFETAVFYLTLYFSGAYLLATLSSLALLVVVGAAVVLGSRRAGAPRRQPLHPEGRLFPSAQREGD